MDQAILYPVHLRVRLALFVMAHNMGNFLRRFAFPSDMSHWSLSSIQLKLIKIGAKIVSHSRIGPVMWGNCPLTTESLTAWR